MEIVKQRINWLKTIIDWFVDALDRCFSGGRQRRSYPRRDDGSSVSYKRFNPEMNASFKTYAEICIKRRLISAVKSASSLKHNPLNDGVPLTISSQKTVRRTVRWDWNFTGASLKNRSLPERANRP